MSQAHSAQNAQIPGSALKTPQPLTGPYVPVTSVHTIEADGVRMFYRAAGDPNSPVVLLLHGFPTSSFMFRELIPRLASDYRVIAPDLPGFGFTEVPAERKYVYSFDRLAATHQCVHRRRSRSGALQCMCSTMAHQPDCVWRWLTRIA